MQLLFETFNVSGFYASEQAVLSLYAVGRISGCTVDIGHGKIGMCMNALKHVRFNILGAWFYTRVCNGQVKIFLLISENIRPAG